MPFEHQRIIHTWLGALQSGWRNRPHCHGDAPGLFGPGSQSWTRQCRPWTGTGHLRLAPPQ